MPPSSSGTPSSNDPLAALAIKSIPYLLAIIIAGGGYYLARIDSRIASLESLFSGTQRSIGELDALLKKYPDLEKTISQTREDIAGLKSSQEYIQTQVKDNHYDLKQQLNNIQHQIHTIPGIKP
jgi:hypothetical protein